MWAQEQGAVDHLLPPARGFHTTGQHLQSPGLGGTPGHIQGKNGIYCDSSIHNALGHISFASSSSWFFVVVGVFFPILLVNLTGTDLVG